VDVTKKTFRNHNNLNCDRIFRAKRQLSLIPLYRTAALPAALSNLTRPIRAIRRLSGEEAGGVVRKLGGINTPRDVQNSLTHLD